MDKIRKGQYSRIDERNSMHQSWTSSTPIGGDSSMTDAYELPDRKVPARSLASHFIEDLPRLSAPKYTAISDQYGADAHKKESGVFIDGQMSTGKVDTSYSPLFTRKWIICCFALLWVVLFVSLQILYSLSETRQGLATTDDSLKYLWTYGPTAILVIVTVVWRQVDYAAKYIQPWAELADGPKSAERTLLLDYVTPFQIVALWKALRLRHITVVCTIIIFVLIKVMTVISTGLLTIQIKSFRDRGQDMQALTVFDGSAGLPIAGIDSRAAVSLYGAQTYDMLLPNGTTDRYAFQLFKPVPNVSLDVYSYNASVEVFSAEDWDCQTGALSYKTGRDGTVPVDSTGISENTPVSGYYNTSISLPDCEIHYGHLDAPDWYWTQNDTTPRYGYWGILQNVNCSNLQDDDPNKQRFVISVAYSKGLGQQNNTLLNTSNVVCRPSYFVQPAFVSIFTNGSLDGDVTFHGERKTLDRVSANDLIRAVRATAQQANLDEPTDATLDAFMYQMVRLTPNFRKEMLLDNKWLAEKSKETYQQYAAQVAGIYLLKDSSGSTTFLGTVAVKKLRLVVKNLPLRIMQGCAAAMLILTIVMLFTMPQHVVPRPVESVAAIAVILARSPILARLLRNTGHMDMAALSDRLTRHRYVSTVEHYPDGKTFSINLISDVEPAPAHTEHKHINWERPFVLRRIAMITTITVALGILIALEVLYRYSNANNGIAEVDTESYEKYAWLYTPVVILVLLGSAYNVLDFELEHLHSYLQLTKGFSPAAHTVLYDALSHITFETGVEAIRRSRFALLASCVSVCFAPFLTIAVSGLFTVVSVSAKQEILPATQTWFNVSTSRSSSLQASRFSIPSLIIQGNMSYPQWTYNELAFPAIDLSEKSTGVANAAGGELVMEMPAARASVNCSSWPQDKIFDLRVGPGESGTQCKDCVTFNLSVANGCGNYGYRDSGMIYLQGGVSFPPSGTGYFGGFTYSSGSTTSNTGEAILCPEFVFTYGRVQDRELKDFSIHSCYTGLERVQTNATIDWNRATIAGEANVISEPTQYVSPWEFSLPTYTAGAYPYMPMINYTHPDEVFDPFMNAMIYGKDGVPKEQLIDNKTLVDQFTHTYRQWMAQYISSFMRNPVDELAKNTSNIAGALPQRVQGVFEKPNRHRLTLSEVSTRILQGVIAVLLICGLVIVILVDMRKVLPKEVGTVGAVASLLAGSRLIDERSGLIPHGSEWMSDEQLRKAGIWDGELFKMGWWPPTDGDGQGHVTQQTAYTGAAGEMYEDDMAKHPGDFRIDARSKHDFPS